MNRLLWTAATAASWYLVCQAISRWTRRYVWPDRSSFPTGWSELFRWLAPIGVIVICGIGLLSYIVRVE